MKPIRIDFAQDRRWQWLWPAAAISGLCIIGLAGWQWRQNSAAAHGMESRTEALRVQLARLSAPKEAAFNPKQASAEQAGKLLRQDLNKVFASVENLKEPGIRLRQLSLDGTSGTLRLEFELDTVAKAASLTAVLNAGYEHKPWQLESITGATNTNPMGFAGGSAIRGLWFVDLGKL
jgi:hypothetical protein